MRHIVISLEPITREHKNHYATFDRLCHEIALWNGNNEAYKDSRDADKFIEQLFKGTGLHLEKRSPVEYGFGNSRKKPYVCYGTILKTVLLN